MIINFKINRENDVKRKWKKIIVKNIKRDKKKTQIKVKWNINNLIINDPLTT